MWVSECQNIIELADNFILSGRNFLRVGAVIIIIMFGFKGVFLTLIGSPYVVLSYSACHRSCPL